MLFAFVFLCYYVVIGAPFLWDDEVMVLGNDAIKQGINLKKIFSTGAFGEPLEKSSFYRPIQVASYSLNYMTDGINPKVFHLTNIFIHLFSCIVLLFFLRELFSPKVSFLTALIFAVHPINIENATYVSGRGDVLNILFSFLSLFLFLRALKKQKLSYAFFSLLAYLLALFSKENTILLPFALFLILFLKKEKNFQMKKTHVRSILVLFFVAMGGYLFLRFSIFEKQTEALSIIAKADFLERFFTFIKGIVVYFRLLIFPWKYHMEYHFLETSPFSFYPIFLLGMLLLLYVSVRKKWIELPFVIFLVGWFFVFLAPVSNLSVPLPSSIREHWASFSSVAFFLLLVVGIEKIFLNARKPIVKNLVLTFSFVWFVYIVGYTHTRNKDWTDAFTLYENDAALSPKSFILWTNLGVEYYRKNNEVKAKECWEKSQKVCPPPGYAPTQNNLGVIEMNNARYDAAIKYFRKAILLDNYLLSYQSLSELLLALKRIDEARAVLSEGLSYYPKDSSLLQTQQRLLSIEPHQ